MSVCCASLCGCSVHVHSRRCSSSPSSPSPSWTGLKSWLGGLRQGTKVRVRFTTAEKLNLDKPERRAPAAQSSIYLDRHRAPLVPRQACHVARRVGAGTTGTVATPCRHGKKKCTYVCMYVCKDIRMFFIRTQQQRLSGHRHLTVPESDSCMY